MLFVIFLSSFSKSTIDAEHMNILLLAERKVLFFFLRGVCLLICWTLEGEGEEEWVCIGAAA